MSNRIGRSLKGTRHDLSITEVRLDQFHPIKIGEIAEGEMHH